MRFVSAFVVVLVPWVAMGCGVMYKGASGCDDGTHKLAVDVMGATHMRAYLHWRYVQPKLRINSSVTVANVIAHPEMIEEWAASGDVNWAVHDHRVQVAVDAGLKVLGEVGEGTLQGLPSVVDEEGEEVMEAGKAVAADPKQLGQEIYLGYMYMTTRAIVRRFKKDISFWQIENEFNEAYLASLGAQRSFYVLNNPWKDFDLLTAVIKTLRMAVIAEQPTALVTQNVHTDISKEVHDRYHVPAFYLDAVKAWDEYIDVWSLDSYPNYFGASPVLGSVVGDRVRELKKVIGNKDVFVMETGYPVLNDSSVAPADIVNYSEARQAEYALQAWNSTIAAGGCGMLFFTVRASTGLMTPPGGWTDADVAFISQLAAQEKQGSLFELAGWLATHPREVERIAGLIDYNTAWGTVRKDGVPRDVMRALGGVWKGKE